MNYENAKYIKDSKLEQVTGGMLIDNTDWVDLYNTKYYPQLNHLYATASSNDKPLWSWMMQELNSLTLSDRNVFIRELYEIKKRLVDIKFAEINACSYVRNKSIKILNEIELAVRDVKGM